jgi:YihY family inner membrane protein
VLRRFQRHHGFLLASALAYNGLLSLVPLIGITLVVLSHVVPAGDLLRALHFGLEATLPGESVSLERVFVTFLDQRAAAGVLGTVALVVFSTFAFISLDRAITAVFETRRRRRRGRHPIISFLLPLAYVGLVVVGLLLLTLLTVGLDLLPEERWAVLGFDLSIVELARFGLRIAGFVGTTALLASFYHHLPDVEVRGRHAIVGALVAAVLWQVVRFLLLWYFDNLSLVGVVYGSLATVVVMLLGLEAAALILLLGAQVIAEMGRSAQAGIHWWEEPAQSQV